MTSPENQASSEAQTTDTPAATVVGVCVGLAIVGLFYYLMTAFVKWLWITAVSFFWFSIGRPFVWLSNHTDETPPLPCSPMGVLTCFLLICVLCIDKEDAEESFVKMGIAYAVVVIMGFLASF